MSTDSLIHSGLVLEEGGFYLATGLPDCYPNGEQPFIVSIAHGGPFLAVWGFSIYRRRPGYRTLGQDLREWLARHPGVVVQVDRDRRLDPNPKHAKAVVVPDPAATVIEQAALATALSDDGTFGRFAAVAWLFVKTGRPFTWALPCVERGHDRTQEWIDPQQSTQLLRWCINKVLGGGEIPHLLLSSDTRHDWHDPRCVNEVRWAEGRPLLMPGDPPGERIYFD